VEKDKAEAMQWATQYQVVELQKFALFPAEIEKSCDLAD
jgi:hypothetical protein